MYVELADLRAEVEKLTRQRDEARRRVAELSTTVERLRRKQAVPAEADQQAIGMSFDFGPTLRLRLAPFAAGKRRRP